MHRHVAPYPHGVLDYAIVALLLLAPSWFAFEGTPAVFCYVLAAVHLGLSLATAYPLGALKIIPFPAHGRLELIVGAAMVALPWIGLFSGVDDKARWFFIIAGLAVMGLYAITDYRTTADERAATA